MTKKLIFLFTFIFSIFASAESDPKTVQLKIDYSILICSHDHIYQYPCEVRKLKSESVDFALSSCADYSNGQFCDAEWRPDFFVVDGLGFSVVVFVQNLTENTGQSETTIYGFMKSGKEPDKNETDFSLFIDSGKLHDPVRVAGVTLDKPLNEQGRIFSYTPQLKISPLIQDIIK